jgi:xylulokinase
MAIEVFLGVDVGTSSTKAVAVDESGRVVRLAQRQHRVDWLRPGYAEMSPGLWWREFVAVTQELLEPGDLHVSAVGVDGMGPCVVIADSNGEALRPAILYGIDTRAEAEIVELNERYSELEIRCRGGSALSSQAVGPKLLWLSMHEPELFGKARRLLMPSSYLVQCLTGEYVLDHHSASQATPLYDVPSLSWYGPWWDDLCARIEPPRLVWPQDRVGIVTASAACESGLPVGTPVVAGTIDAWSEAVSVDAQNVGDLMLMYGSTMFLIHTLSEAIPSPTLWTTVGAFQGTFSLAGGMATAGALMSWLGDCMGESDPGRLLAEAAKSGPGASGLLMLPYLAGERTPIFDPHARGVVVGLTLSHTRGDLYRAALEAVAFGVRHNLDAIAAAGAAVRRAVAVGGGTTGRLWTQIVSDVTGLEQELRDTSVGGSYGSAFLAARAVGSFSIADWNPLTAIVRPNPDERDRYDERYELYCRLYPATAEFAHALAKEQLHLTTPEKAVLAQ